ncbi:RTX toxin transporter [Moritella sp. PE36]|uniref:type I secretion system permease/ATPase n=1 Tax=Moritella sp. PE36 TaxID=58051 RepID=UPI0001568EF6|nr:type I secretion system permease/ATPase [Moritella sp. PE36]EDM65960.1 RTX toxin transporter [Moritella sp. PE36]
MTTQEHSAIACIHLLLKVLGENITVKAKQEYETRDFKRVRSDIKKEFGVTIKVKKLKKEKMNTSELPCIFKTCDGQYYILANSKVDQHLIQSPLSQTPEIWSDDKLCNLWAGEVILLSKKSMKFDISWFIPAFLEHKKILSEILLFSFILQILALISPLFFQVVMDKVLVHQAWTTLDVLVFGLVVTGIFEVLLRGLREYLYAHTANRIDIHLGIKLVQHLFGLPLLYFKNRQVGTIVMRVRELDTIREFLTGSMFTLLVDALFMGVFIFVMHLLSPTLTLIFVASIPCYIVLAIWLTPRMQQRVEVQYTHAAANTSFLTETISGAETIKSLAVEPRLQQRWDKQTTDMVASGYQTQLLSNKSNHFVQLFQKVTSVCILWVGATHVLDLKMTIGQLIAFNMMANHIAQPLSRLVELWGQFIQARVGIEKLGEMLNLPFEQSSGSQTPILNGDIVFRDVTFRYQPDEPPIINAFNLVIPAGQTLGVVGSSGSGKSTLARLLLRLYLPERGLISVGQYGLNDVDVTCLRQQIGVVQQENFLFNKTVRENIAQSLPSASLDEVVEAAKLSGAHEFILKLPMGYDTVIAEGGSSLSGGQRQRLAIARTLLSDPKILILDEATSALDDESQTYIQANMAKVAKGRTVITIAHRLSTVRQCDQLIVLNEGEIVEKGSHEELLRIGHYYKQLWLLQQELKQEKSQ